MENFDIKLNEKLALIVCSSMLALYYSAYLDQDSKDILFDNVKRLFKSLPENEKKIIKEVEDKMLKNGTVMEKLKRICDSIKNINL